MGVYDAVIFDNDGVLVELPRQKTLRSAAREAYATVGVEDPDPADVRAVTAGVTPDLVNRLADDYGFDPDAFWRARDRHAAAAQQADAEAGAVEPFHDADAVREFDHPAAVVSANQQSTVEFLLDRFGLADRFVSAYGRRPGVADLHNKKPDPHYVERAVADIEAANGHELDRVLMVGDSESDVRAAHNAGIDGAYLHRPHRNGNLSVSPDHELDGLDELVDLLAGD